mmetsp:Transcript_50652/g.127611  ORF Transcript_50652/g.127611 Transcript_50652/m.127611 type:complete len:256 (+) Transcript_50652:442-1209(+)
MREWVAWVERGGSCAISGTPLLQQLLRVLRLFVDPGGLRRPSFDFASFALALALALVLAPAGGRRPAPGAGGVRLHFATTAAAAAVGGRQRHRRWPPAGWRERDGHLGGGRTATGVVAVRAADVDLCGPRAMPHRLVCRRLCRRRRQQCGGCWNNGSRNRRHECRGLLDERLAAVAASRLATGLVLQRLEAAHEDGDPGQTLLRQVPRAKLRSTRPGFTQPSVQRASGAVVAVLEVSLVGPALTDATVIAENRRR